MSFRPLLLSALAGLLLFAAAPPLNLTPCIWVGLAGLAWTLDPERGAAPAPRPPRGWRRHLAGGGRGFAFGFAANVVALGFMPGLITRFAKVSVSAAWGAALLLATLQALRWCLAGWVHGALLRRRIPAPVAFAVAVYVSTFVPGMIPWMPGAVSTAWLSVYQLADVVGERGVQAFLALVAALVARAFSLRADRRRASQFLALAAVLQLALVAYGKVRLARVAAHLATLPHARIALIAPNIAASVEHDDGEMGAALDKLARLTAQAETENVDFSIWPEAAYPYGQRQGKTKVDELGLGQLALWKLQKPVLTGMEEIADDGFVNAAGLLTTEGTLTPRYGKMHLFWFGETLPLLEELPFLRRFVPRGAGLLPGSKQVLFDIAGVKAAVLLCIEDVLPYAAREAVALHPELMVNLTDDAWFLGSNAPQLHLHMAQMRAIETRLDLIRAVNYGPTSWVDATGVVRAQSDDWQPTYLVVTPALSSDPSSLTFYARFGDLPFALLLAVGVALHGWRRRPAARTGAFDKGAAPMPPTTSPRARDAT